MKRFCKSGAESLTEQMFKKQVDFENKGKTRKLFAFKAYQMRAYGFIAQLAGERVFVITKVDPKKKQTRANSAHLETAKTRGKAFIDAYES